MLLGCFESFLFFILKFFTIINFHVELINNKIFRKLIILMCYWKLIALVSEGGEGEEEDEKEQQGEEFWFN